MAAEHDSTLRIVLVGHTGAGKSSSGNTILADKAFNSECCPKAVTEFCEKKKGKVENRDVLVVDTPGLNDAEMTEEKLKSEIGKCFEMCAPGPHALLLVIRLSRFTEEQQAAVKWIPENFGKEALKYTIVLFTGKDDLDGKSVEKFVSENTCLQQVVHDCGGRYHAFNNRGGSHRQVTELFSKIENMLQINKADYYRKEMYKSTQDDNAQREKERKGNEVKKEKEHKKNIQIEVLKVVKEKAETLKHDAVVWQVGGAFAGAAIGGLIGFGAGGIGAPAGAKAGAKVVTACMGSVGLGVAGYYGGPIIGGFCGNVADDVLKELNVNSAEKDKTD